MSKSSIWQIKQVKDVFKIGRGRVISQIEIREKPGQFPVYSSQSTNNGEMGRINSYDFEGEYVTWTTDGAYAGTVFYRSGKFNCTNVCGTLKPLNEQEIDCRFAAAYLSRIAKNHVSYVGNPKLMNNIFAEIEFATPPLAVQKKIADILDSVDRMIELTSMEIVKLKDLKKGMMHELLTKGIGHTKFKDSPLGKVPEAWVTHQLSELLTYSAFGPRFSSDEYASQGNYRLFRTTDINDDGEIDYSTMPIANLTDSSFKNHVLQDGDVQVTRSGTIGVVTVFERKCSDRDTIPGAFLINLRVIKDKIYPDFLKAFLMSIRGQEQIKRLSAGGVQQNLSGTNLKQLYVTLPTLKEQSEIVCTLNGITKNIYTKQHLLKKIEFIKKGLMNDLLTGKVTVKV